MILRNSPFHQNLYTNNQTTSLLLIVVLSVVMAFLPLVGLCLSILFFRQKFAPWLFILFAFYFGWFYEPQMDLLVHYKHFSRIIDKSLLEQWNDIGTLKYGKEAYPVLFKYIIGKITNSKNLFSACACSAYTALFIFGVIKPLRPYYMQKMSFPSCLIFLGTIFTVEYYWFLGFRFWSGVFVFTGFYLKYIYSKSHKYLYLSALCLLFHYSLLALFTVAIFNHFLQNKPKFYYPILAISFIVRFAKFGLIWIITQIEIFNGYVKDNNRNHQIQQSIEQLTDDVRNNGNQFYLLRETFGIIGILAVIYVLYRKTGKDFLNQNIKLWGMCILLISLANFGYVNITFYDRFFKIAVLFLYIFAYIWIMTEQYKLNFSSQLIITIIAITPVLYLIITPLVEQRQTLFQLSLWFNSLLLQ